MKNQIFIKNKILGKWKTFTSSEREIMNYVLFDKWETLSIKELAKKTNKSPSLISSLMKKIGYNGFREFIFDWKNEVDNVEENSWTNKNDVLKKLNYISKGYSSIDYHKLTIMCNDIYNYDQIWVMANGSNSLAIEEMRNKFSRIGKPINSLKNTNDIRNKYFSHEQTHLFIIFSIRALESVFKNIMSGLNEMKNVKIVLITANKETKLLTLSDYHFIIPDNKIYQDVLEISPIFTLLIFIEILYFSYTNIYFSEIIDKWNASWVFEKRNIF